MLKLLLFFSSVALFVFTYNNGQKQEDYGLSDKYAVVVDCGSSGSRAHIYRWPRNTSSAELPIKIEHAKDTTTGKDLIMRIKPGISEFRDEPDRASNYMEPIMEFVSKNIPPELHSETPVYFMGTAGLRLLTREEQDNILADLRNDLRTKFDFPLLYSEVISGAREGQYQWLSVNSDRNRLTPFYDITTDDGARDKLDLHCKSALRRRFAILEMGGASAQVTFELSNLIERMITFKLSRNPRALGAFRNSTLVINVGHKRRAKIFSSTFLGFGTNSARELAIDLLVREALHIAPNSAAEPSGIGQSSITLEDVCLPKGAQQTFEKPIELIKNSNKNLGYVLTGAEPAEDILVVKLTGNGNYKKCRHLLERMVSLVRDEETNCDVDEAYCSTALLGAPFIPFKFYQFLGLAEFLYTTREMLRQEGPFNPLIITKKTMEICATSFSELLRKYPEANRVDPQRVLLECFKATWMLTFLQVGLRMPSNVLTDFNTVENKNDWTLGALIDKLHP